jgi:hypothetical protein
MGDSAFAFKIPHSPFVKDVETTLTSHPATRKAEPPLVNMVQPPPPPAALVVHPWPSPRCPGCRIASVPAIDGRLCWWPGISSRSKSHSVGQYRLQNKPH